MSIRTAAREVVAACALAKEGTLSNGGWGGYLTQDLSDAIARLQKVLDVSADADALGAEINARRRDDDAEQMRAFEAKFWQLAEAWRLAGGRYHRRDLNTETDALSRHLFGHEAPL